MKIMSLEGVVREDLSSLIPFGQDHSCNKGRRIIEIWASFQEDLHTYSMASEKGFSFTEMSKQD